jgi:CRP/FNR family cyclic AMP-dependent transcriptional regulator
MEALRYLTDNERVRLLARSDTRTFAAGEQILAEGVEQEAIYILVSGRARVERHEGGTTILVDEMGAGEAFGEMSLLDGASTHLGVTADEACEVRVLELGGIADLLEDDPVLASHLYHSLAVTLIRRLRDRTDELTDLRAGGSSG